MADARAQQVVHEPVAVAEVAQKTAGPGDMSGLVPTNGFVRAAVGAGVATPRGLGSLMSRADAASRTHLAMHLQRSIGNSALHDVLAARQAADAETGQTGKRE
jgi:hypothetical protein